MICSKVIALSDKMALKSCASCLSECEICSIGQQNQQFSSGQYKDPPQSAWCFVCQIISKKCLQQLLFYFSPLSFGLHFTMKILQKLFPFLRINQFFMGQY